MNRDTITLWLFLWAVHIFFTMHAATDKDLDLLYSYEYDISSDYYCFCLPKFVIKNKVILFDKQKNSAIAEGRYIINPFSTIAELKKSHTWIKNSGIKKKFLPLIIRTIQKNYPSISELHYVSHEETIIWTLRDTE